MEGGTRWRIGEGDTHIDTRIGGTTLLDSMPYGHKRSQTPCLWSQKSHMVTRMTAKEFKEACKAQGLTYAKAADQWGVSASSIKMWASGKRSIPEDIVEKLKGEPEVAWEEAQEGIEELKQTIEKLQVERDRLLRENAALKLKGAHPQPVSGSMKNIRRGGPVSSLKGSLGGKG